MRSPNRFKKGVIDSLQVVELELPRGDFMKLLVTGGAGFIGSNFILDWLRAGLGDVINYDKLTYAANLENLAEIHGDSRYIFVQGDVVDQTRLEEVLLTYRPDAAVHFAAESHVDRSIHAPIDFVNTNVLGTFSLLEAIRSYLGKNENLKRRFRLLHVSTDEVFGALDLDDLPSTERNRYSPSNPYSASKASSDHFVRSYFRTYELPVLLSHCSNNYGPRQFPEKLIPKTITNAFNGLPIPVYGRGDHRRDWIYVGDHCSALRQILRNGELGESYNVGAQNEISNLQTVTSICDLVDELAGPLSQGPRRSLIRFVDDRPGHDWRYALDATKLSTKLGWTPMVNFTEGLKLTVEWYLENKREATPWIVQKSQPTLGL